MENENFATLGYRVGVRFMRGFVTGAVANMVVVQAVNVMSTGDLANWIAALLFAAVTGGITGGLLAVDKLMRG